MENLEKKFTRLITTYRVDEALNLLLDLVISAAEKYKSEKNAIMILLSRYHKLKLEKYKGVISPEDSLLESNKILDGILGVSDYIFKELKKNEQDFLQKNKGSKGESRVIYDSNNFMHYEGKISVGVFNTARNFENIETSFTEGNLTWTLIAEEDELVGINFFLRILKGHITFEYQILESNTVQDNVIFHVIPMKSNYDLVEVGSNTRADPANAFNPYRLRKVGRLSQENWISENIEFNFLETPEAREVVFAPRINEGSPRPGRGVVRLRNVKIVEC